ncbi:MAG: hypothetical protein QF479_06410 [Candidatus Poseidoniaceae archaeon]|nr:hypothetical protein [Candidatus Poseidoniaceae archaeon]
MGFKAKARKHNPDGGKKDDSKNNKSKNGEQPCGVKGCEKFSDKSVGGRSLSIDNAIEMWGSGNYSDRKGRVRVCKSCYRKWKKENKSDDAY